MMRPEQDAEMEGKEGKVCQMDFSFVEVVSCVESLAEDPTANPIYEMKRDGSGKPFESVLNLRAAKFRSHVEQMQEHVQSVHAVKYESLVAATNNSEGKAVPGIFDLLETLASTIHLEWSCPPPKADTLRSASPFSTDFVKFMNKHVDWTAESLFGYTPMDENAIPGGAADDDTQPSDVNDDQSNSAGEQKTATPYENLGTVPPQLEQKPASEHEDETGRANDGAGDDSASDDEAPPETSAQKPLKPSSAPSSPAEERKPQAPSFSPAGAEGPEKTSNVSPQSPLPSSSEQPAKHVSSAPSSTESAISKPIRPDEEVTPSTPSLPPKIDGTPSKPGDSEESENVNDDVDATINYDDGVENVSDDNAGDDSEVAGDGDDDDSGDKFDDGGDDEDDDEGDGEVDDEVDDEGNDKTNDADDRYDDEGEEASKTLPPDKILSPQPSSYPTLHVSETPSSYPTLLVTPKPSVSETPEPTAPPSLDAKVSQSSAPQESETGDGGHGGSAKKGKTSSDIVGNEAADSDKEKKKRHNEHSHNAGDGNAHKHDSESSGKVKTKAKHISHRHSDQGESESHPKHKKNADDNSNENESSDTES